MSAGGSDRSLAAMRSAQLRSVGTAFLRKRPLIVGPGMVACLGLLSLADVPARQQFILLVAFTVLLIFFCGEAWQLRRTAITEASLFRSLLITMGGITMGCVITGSLASPLIPILFAPVVIAFAAFGRAKESTIAFSLACAAFAIFAALPRGTPFPAIATPEHGLIVMLSTLISLLLLKVGVTSLSDAYSRSSAAADKLRMDLLVETATHARSVEAIGARVAHELKNPLAAIKGLVQLLSRSASGERDRTRLQVVTSEIERMQQIIADYLSFSRPSAELQVELVDVRALADDMVAVVEARAALAGVTLHCAGDSVTIAADPSRLKQALLNLLINAVQACRSGDRVSVATAATSWGCSVAIADTGAGMDEATLNRMATPFFSTRADGTGLGAVIAQGAIRQHGGHVRVSSVEGAGTTVSIELPTAPGGACGHA